MTVEEFVYTRQRQVLYVSHFLRYVPVPVCCVSNQHLEDSIYNGIYHLDMSDRLERASEYASTMNFLRILIREKIFRDINNIYLEYHKIPLEEDAIRGVN